MKSEKWNIPRVCEPEKDMDKAKGGRDANDRNMERIERLREIEGKKEK